MIGTKLSHYSILERIGAGGMGEVYKAFDSRLDRPVALKVLHPSAVADEGKRQRFLQEARAASALNHPNILTIYEIGQEDEHYYIATEYIEGQTLRQKLQSGPPPLQVVLEIAIQTAKAIGAAHLAGIVHRDIKPENIMIRPDGYVKVLDFGLAKLLESAIAPGAASGRRRRHKLVKTETNIVLGTVRYMSPEQVQGLPIDHRCDIFSFGILLYEMLTGRLPFGGEKPIDIAYEIIGSTPPPLGEMISGPALELQPLVNRCLEKNREARYQDAQSLLKELRKLQRRIDLMQGPQTGDLSQERIELGRATRSVRPSIVVIYFENLVGEPELEWWRKALMDLLTLRLISNTRLDVVSSEQMADILAQLACDEEAEIDKATAWEISRRAGAEICLLGSFMALPGSVTLSAHLHEVSTGRLITSLAARRSRADDLFALVDEIADRIERELKVVREGEPQEVAGLVTSSLAALRAFEAGLEHYYRAEFSAAEEQFRQALAADPQFVLAYYYLARVERCQEKAEYRIHLNAALERLGRMSERERLLALLEEAAAERDYIAQLSLAEELVVQYPREKLGYFFLGESYHWRGECERAFVVFQQALALDQKLLFHGVEAGVSSIFESYIDTGRFESAEELARKQAAIGPQNWLAHQLLGIALSYRRRYTEADAALARAAELDSSGSAYPGLWRARIRILGGEYEAAEQQLHALMDGRAGLERSLCWRDLTETLRERGRLRDWLKTLTREQELFAGEPNPDPSFAPQFRRAYFFEQIGELPRALNELRIADFGLRNEETGISPVEFGNPQSAIHNPQSNNPQSAIRNSLESVWARVHLGRLQAACGDYERAAELAEQVKLIGSNMPNPKIERLALFLWGAIEFYQGNYGSAAELLERSIWSYYNGFTLSIRMLAQCLRQLKQYERALELLDGAQPYGTASSCGRFCSRTELDLEMAKTYEAAGDGERAIEFYRKCLQAWATADADFVGRLEATTGFQWLMR